MPNSPQNPGQPSGDVASAVTMDDVIRFLDGAAVSGVPAAIGTDDLAALALYRIAEPPEVALAQYVLTEDILDLAAAHGCAISGPYLGDGEHIGSYYLFERRKAA